MHNINYIRENPVEFDNYMKSRGESSISKKIIDIDKQKREAQTALQNLLADRNQLSKTIGKLKGEKKDANNEIRKSDFSEDIRANYELDIQEITDKYVKKIDSIFSSKEAEILKV